MGPMCVTLPNFIKIGQTVAEMWRFNNFHNVGRPPSSILEIQFLFVRPLNRPILHNHAKFREHLSIPCGDMAICVVFKMTTAAILFFKIRNFNGVSPSPCQISSKSVKRFRRYGDLTVFKMAAVRHLGFWKSVWTVKRPILRIRAKFREDLPIRCCDNYRDFCGFSRWRPPPSWFLKNSKF